MIDFLITFNIILLLISIILFAYASVISTHSKLLHKRLKGLEVYVDKMILLQLDNTHEILTEVTEAVKDIDEKVNKLSEVKPLKIFTLKTRS